MNRLVALITQFDWPASPYSYTPCVSDFPAQIRKATQDDAKGIFEMACALATSATPRWERFVISLDAIVKDPLQLVAVADHGAKLAGYLCGLAHPAFHANGRVGWVEELYVSENARGLGLGRNLMDFFERWAFDEQEVSYVAVSTRRAQAFYESIGYAESATYFKKKHRETSRVITR